MLILKKAAPAIVFAGLSAFGFATCVQAADAAKASEARAKIRSIEEQTHSHIGVSVRNAEGAVLFEWRSRERFALCSTVKALECARVYALQLENNSARIDSVAALEHEPVLGQAKPGETATLKEACRVALSVSDNRAANFIFSLTGGPQALTDWLREWGDMTTRSDRTEPDLNTFKEGDERDTTVPSAITQTWFKFDTKLPESAHALWLEDLSHNRVADGLMRKSLPAGWSLFDRSGAGSEGDFATRANHGIAVDTKGGRYYIALHVRAPKGTPMSERDKTLNCAATVVFDLLQARLTKTTK